MIEVSMAPLAPKLKRETRDGQTVIVARCGVRDCPERLAELPTQSGAAWRIRFADGYEFSIRGNCWRKSRRAAKRSLTHKEFAYSVIEAENSNANAGYYLEAERRQNAHLDARLPRHPTSQEINEVIESVDYSDLRAIEAGLKARHSDLVNTRDQMRPATPEDEDTGPFVVKCARCGRFSKISLSAGK